MELEQKQMIARKLIEAECQKIPIPLLSEEYPELTYDEAFSIHMETIRYKVESGEHIIGKKIGLTNKTIQKQAGVYEPDLGIMTDVGFLNTGAVLYREDYIIPAMEVEVAFILKDDLNKEVLFPHDVVRATEYIIPAIEIVDTRFGTWNFKIQDTVADSASYSRVILGDRMRRLDEVDLSCLGMYAEVNGEVAMTGCSVSVMGNPINAVCWLANKMVKYGTYLKKGEIIMSGAFSGTFPLKPGQSIDATVGTLGNVKLKIE